MRARVSNLFVRYLHDALHFSAQEVLIYFLSATDKVVLGMVGS